MSLPATALGLPPVEIPTARTVRGLSLASHGPWLAAAIAVAAGLVALNAIPIGGFYDDAFYVILAKSIATGHGYRNLNLPGAPYATHYPPGYPLFLAVLWKLGPAFPANLLLFKLANVAFLGVAAAFAFKLGRDRIGLSAAAALVAAVAGTATTPALYLSSMLLSEMMFLALALPFLIWAERVTRERERVRTALMLGACAGLLFLVRSQAIALIGAVALVYATRRRWRESAAAIGAAAIVVLPWLLWTGAHDAAVPVLMRGDYGSYFAWFIDGLRERGPGLVVDTLRKNLPDVFDHVAHRLRPQVNPLPNAVASSCIGLLGILGVTRLVRRAPVTLAFLGGYLAIVVVWPFAPVRFLLGVWVLLMLVLATGVQVLFDNDLPNVARLASRPVVARVAGAMAALVLVVGAIAYNVRGYQRHFWSNTSELSARWIAPKLTWIATNTDSSAIIATDHDEGTVYLYTGRRSVPVTTFTASEYLEPRPIEADAAALRSLVAHFAPQYLVLSSIRLRPAAATLSNAGVPLGDGTHKVVPWAFTLAVARVRSD